MTMRCPSTTAIRVAVVSLPGALTVDCGPREGPKPGRKKMYLEKGEPRQRFHLCSRNGLCHDFRTTPKGLHTTARNISPSPADLRPAKNLLAAHCYRARQTQRSATTATATTSGKPFHSRRRFQRLKSHAGCVRGNDQSRLSGSSSSSSSSTDASNAKNTSRKAVSR